MKLDEINHVLEELFPEQVQSVETGLWQVETPRYRLLVLVSEDQSWLRVLVPIAPAAEAQPYLAQLLAANFDQTQETRYALHQDVLWGVYHHSCESLVAADLKFAITRLISLYDQGLSNSFTELVESQIRLIIQAAKQQGQTLEETLQQLNHFYEEGLMGEMDSPQPKEAVLASWKYQLERLWSEETP